MRLTLTKSGMCRGGLLPRSRSVTLVQPYANIFFHLKQILWWVTCTPTTLKPTDSIYFRSGQDCASEHRVHKRVHPPGGHRDDGRQPSMDSSCGFKGHLDHLKHPPLGVAHSPTISKHDLTPSPPSP